MLSMSETWMFKNFNNKMNKLTKIDILNFLTIKKKFLKKEFGVDNIILFGSFARGEETEFSDIDFYIEMAPDFFKKCKLIEYLENNFNRKVDIIRNHPGIKSRFMEEIKREGMYVR